MSSASPQKGVPSLDDRVVPIIDDKGNAVEKTGVVIKWIPHRGFGFIVADDERDVGNGADDWMYASGSQSPPRSQIFCHMSQIFPEVKLSVGTRVRFIDGYDCHQMKRRAMSVVALSSPAGAPPACVDERRDAVAAWATAEDEEVLEEARRIVAHYAAADKASRPRRIYRPRTNKRINAVGAPRGGVTVTAMETALKTPLPTADGSPTMWRAVQKCWDSLGVGGRRAVGVLTSPDVGAWPG